MVDAGGRVELFEAKWTELPGRGDTVNLAFVRAALDAPTGLLGSVVCRAPHSYPLDNDFKAIPVAELA